MAGTRSQLAIRLYGDELDVLTQKAAAIAALYVSGQYLSVPAAVGFIALFGVAVLNGVVLVAYINQLRARGIPMGETIPEGCRRCTPGSQKGKSRPEPCRS